MTTKSQETCLPAGLWGSFAASENVTGQYRCHEPAFSTTAATHLKLIKSSLNLASFTRPFSVPPLGVFFFELLSLFDRECSVGEQVRLLLCLLLRRSPSNPAMVVRGRLQRDGRRGQARRLALRALPRLRCCRAHCGRLCCVEVAFAAQSTVEQERGRSSCTLHRSSAARVRAHRAAPDGLRIPCSLDTIIFYGATSRVRKRQWMRLLILSTADGKAQASIIRESLARGLASQSQPHSHGRAHYLIPRR